MVALATAILASVVVFLTAAFSIVIYSKRDQLRGKKTQVLALGTSVVFSIASLAIVFSANMCGETSIGSKDAGVADGGTPIAPPDAGQKDAGFKENDGGREEEDAGIESSSPPIGLDGESKAQKYLALAGEEKDSPKAIALLLSSCRKRNDTGCELLAGKVTQGIVLKLAKEGKIKPADKEDALLLLKESCARMRHLSCNAVGKVYRNGIGEKRSVTEAGIYFEKSCEIAKASKSKKLHPHGCANLAPYYARALGGKEKNVPYAEELFSFACDRGVDWACNQLGDLLMSAIAGKKKKKAIEAYEKGCELGDDIACSKLE